MMDPVSEKMAGLPGREGWLADTNHWERREIYQ